MATPQGHGKDKNKNATPPPAPPAKAADTTTGGATPATQAKAEDGKGGDKTAAKRKRTTLRDPSNPQLWCRMYVDVVEKHGKPMNAKGEEWVVRPAGVFGKKASPEEKAAREAAKAAQKAAFDALSPDEKLAHAKKQREERDAAKAAKKAQEREALIAQLKAEIAAGTV